MERTGAAMLAELIFKALSLLVRTTRANLSDIGV
jgi:hypothetical protein